MRFSIPRTLLALTAFLGTLTGCDSGESPQKPASESQKSMVTASAPSAVNKTSVNALPFDIETVMLSDQFQNDLKLARVNVRVSGGSKNEWIATAIAISREVGGFGADSVEVIVRRSDLDGLEAPDLYRRLAQVMYSPNPKHSIWDGSDLISVADRVASVQQIHADNEYNALNTEFIDKGMDIDAADKKAAAMVVKKFHLPKDWVLFDGGVGDTKLSFDDFNVNTSLAEGSMNRLDSCMRGKIIRILRPC
jgi:hypothetical protein